MCEFIGHTDNDKTERAGRRFFHFFKSPNMTVDAEVVYEITAHQHRNGEPNADSVQTIKQDISSRWNCRRSITKGFKV